MSNFGHLPVTLFESKLKLHGIMGTMRKLFGRFYQSRLISLSAAIMLSLLSLSFKPSPRNYLESLIMLNGTDYWTLNCSQYICAAERHRTCLARNFWEQGCDGDAFVVQDVPSFEAIDTSKLLPGDIAVRASRPPAEVPMTTMFRPLFGIKCFPFRARMLGIRAARPCWPMRIERTM